MQYLIIILIAMASGSAHAAKVLVENKKAENFLFEVGPGYGFGPDLKVLWDENVDGAIPPADDYEAVDATGTGKNKRLVASAAKAAAKAAKEKALSDARAERAAVEAKIDALEEKLKTKDAKLSDEEMREAMLNLLKARKGK